MIGQRQNHRNRGDFWGANSVTVAFIRNKAVARLWGTYFVPLVLRCSIIWAGLVKRAQLVFFGGLQLYEKAKKWTINNRIYSKMPQKN